jgi:integrase
MPYFVSQAEQKGSQGPSPDQQPRVSVTPKQHSRRFGMLDQEAQLREFLAWVPAELRDAPLIDWTQFPVDIMRYCVCWIGESPDATPLALVAASGFGAMTNYTLLTFLRAINRLLQKLRRGCHMEQLSDLAQEDIWQRFVADLKLTEGARAEVKDYSSMATRHLPGYLQRLETQNRLRLKAYVLPPLPHAFRQKYFPDAQFTAASQAKRKANTDVLVPLYPVLRQLVRFRKQLADRTITAIREACRQVEAGEATLPFRFQHSDTLPEVNRDARTIAEIDIQGRTVTMNFLLWDKPTWVRYHRDRFCPEVVRLAELGKSSYAPEKNCFFVQFEGDPADLLWIGDLVEHRLLQTFQKGGQGDEAYRKRQQLARSLGFSNGCSCAAPGLIKPSNQWLTDPAIHRAGDYLFEPECLYRGVVFAAALAMIALSNGSRVSELLQVSWNKERRVTRTEAVVVLGENGLPLLGEGGRPMTKQVKIHLQHLLPKGAKTDEERQLFPLSKECMRLLGEIKHLLEEAHGEIPVVHPSRTSAKYEHLKPERYLFQWGASADGRHGAMGPEAVQVLLRFILHGLDLYTAQGKPIRVSVHVLRHVMASHARLYRQVPAEAIAQFFLHHRLKTLTGRDPSPSEVSEYYFQMTEPQRFAVIRADLEEQEELDRALLRMAPLPRDLEQKNAELQAVYDEWHTLHPTALGNCGCPGLCPRGNDRALCLGCPYHVEDAERIGAAFAWRDSYAKQAELLEMQGNFTDARQARIKVQQLDDMLNVMRLQLQAESEGRYIPLYKVLPSPSRRMGEDEEDI